MSFVCFLKLKWIIIHVIAHLAMTGASQGVRKYIENGRPLNLGKAILTWLSWHFFKKKIQFLCIYSHLTLPAPCQLDVFIPIFQMKTLSLREVK